jgi:hypothetical protein
VPIGVKPVAWTTLALCTGEMLLFFDFLRQGAYEIHLIGPGTVCVVFLAGRIKTFVTMEDVE